MPQPFTLQNTQQKEFTEETFAKIELVKKILNNTSIVFIHQEHEKLKCSITKANNTREKNCEQNALHTKNNSKKKKKITLKKQLL